MNLQLNLSLTLLYESKSPDRGDDCGDDSGAGGDDRDDIGGDGGDDSDDIGGDGGDDGGDVQRNSRNNDSLHSEILRWELHSIDTIVTLITP